jgi:diguanylate cyclase (GGDEF)-like protein
LQAAASGRAEFNAEFRIRRPDGELRWIKALAMIQRNDAGAICRMTGFNEDITERKQAEVALQHSEATNRAILMAIPDLLLRVGLDGTCYDCLPPTKSDQKSLQLIHHHLSEVLPPDLLTQQLQTIARVLQSGIPHTYEHQLLKQGQLCHEEIRIVPCSVDDCLVIVRDITADKQIEMALQQANQQLEAHVNELELRNQEMRMLSEINDFLQVCFTVDEACAAIASLVVPLFPTCSGAIFLTGSSRDHLQQVTAWGTSLQSKPAFQPHECFGLRRSRVHQAETAQPGICCSHVTVNKESATTLCVPMIAQGETLGLFFLNTNEPVPLSKAQQQLARAVAEQVGLAIANLTLRETLQYQSIRDPLTGLFNRRYLEEAFQQELPRAQRHHRSVGVIMVDVDHFKRFNDTYGHEAGDHILQAIGQLLKDNVRGSDIACRYGGEELTLILPETSLEETAARAEELRKMIAELAISHNGTLLQALTASFGIAAFPRHGTNASTLLQVADAALYQAKANGRNQVVVSPILFAD